MVDEWEGTDYTVCPSCKQVVLKESIEKHTHVCMSHSDYMNIPPISDLLKGE
jgi:acetyl-CoA carboxylase beta subunit